MTEKEWSNILSKMKEERVKKEKMSLEEREDYENSILSGDETICVAGPVE